MSFPYDRYPWLNFQELNLAYFIAHFQEIFEQWTQLLTDNEAWKTATEQDLEDWKVDTLGALDIWKAETESSFESWESAALAALTAWQTAAETAFEAIRVLAADSATSAAASATAAAADAASIAASASQIAQNAADIQNKAPAIQATKSGSVIEFEDGPNNEPFIEFTASIRLLQSGEGNPSLNNIRPMTGQTEINIYQVSGDPNNPDVYNINFSDHGTIYTGSMNLITGKLTKTGVVYKASDFIGGHSKSSSTTFDEFFFRTTDLPATRVTSSTSESNIRCSHARPGGSGGMTYTQCRISSSQPRILFPVGTMPSNNAFNTWLADQVEAGTPLQFWYSITPVEYDISSPDIRTKLGYNKIWTDNGGTISLKYNVDTATYIRNEIEKNELPQYWKNELASKIPDIRANELDGNYTSPTICFITDLHWTDNKHYSPQIVKELIKNTNIDYFVNGGDIILNYNASKAGAITELWDCLDAFRDVGKTMITLYGNHDRNRDGNPNRDDPNYALTRKEHMNIVYKSFWTEPGLTFVTTSGSEQWDLVYWEDQNYRYAATYWYLQSGARLPADILTEMFNTTKPLIIFNHGIYFSLAPDMSQDQIQGGWLLVDCEPYASQIKCFIQGHAHQDGLRWAYNGTVPIIILDCDRFRGSPKGQAGTASEQCISVLTINQSSIKMVRVGRGLSFEITPSTQPFLVDYTDYVPSIVPCT